MKKLLAVCLLFWSVFSFSQMDTEHWFAPMVSRVGTTYADGALYLSTNQTAPVTAEIYNNNTLYRTVQVSKGNPQKINIPIYWMITTSESNLYKAVPMGFFVKSDRRIFANYRFSVVNHAEIITSKGFAGLGNKFYVGAAPNTSENQATSNGTANTLNTTVGIIATEDNTSVNISGYNPALVFSDGSRTPSKSVVLNRGESYLLEVEASLGGANLNGLIGAKIESNKPISVTNGNFNSIYNSQESCCSDITMDQSVPIERLGNKFVIVKGNGATVTGMEQLLIIATENGTSIKVNGTTLPNILNEGEYLLIPGNNYISQGGNTHNIGLETTKNVYVYQLLGGTSSGNSYATGGMNFIPALSCFLPNKIDEIALVNDMPYYDDRVNFDTKLNIITEKGAAVKVNGAPINNLYGPYPVNGVPEWETYSIPNVLGNQTITSTKSVTAGIAAGNGAVGYGGYFAGFSSVPSITKSGDCYNGLKLEVDDTYDSYQWYLNGNAITGATASFINPETYGSGSYTVLITKTNCDSKLTAPYVYTKCPPVITKDFDIGICGKHIFPLIFTTSSQTINLSKTKFIVQPKFGKVEIIGDKIHYTPNQTLTNDTNDFYVFSIEGNGTPADIEYFRINIKVNIIDKKNAEITACGDVDGTAFFDLTKAVVSTDNFISKIDYFELKTDAQNPASTNFITNFTHYNSKAKTVYARITDTFGCTTDAEIKLLVPNVNTALFTSEICDNNLDGSVTVNFKNEVTPLIIKDPEYFTVIYSLATNPTVPLGENFTFNTDTRVRVEVRSAALCPPEIDFIDFKIKKKITLAVPKKIEVCDNEIDGKADVILSDYTQLFTTAASPTFYKTFADAGEKSNSISANQTITGDTKFYYRFENSVECPAIGVLEIQFNQPKKSTVLQDQIICKEKTATLDAGSGFTKYKWSTGATSQSIVVSVGDYYVDLEYNNSCVYRQYVKVVASDVPVITNIDVEGNRATVFVSGGTIPYQYSKDGITWQDSPILTDNARGLRTAYVKDKYNCAPVTKEFLILNLLNVITPNGDGYNDLLDYSDLRIKNDVSIQVFDRFGSLVFQSADQKYIWDGKIKGRPVPTASYWYLIKWIEPDTGVAKSYKGWVLVKNR